MSKTDLIFVSSSAVSAVRPAKFRDQDFLVAPVVALVAGVVNGELVPAEELEAGVKSWNGRPLTVGHPVADGSYISANTPAVLEEYAVGSFFGSEYAGGKLKGEVWVDLGLASMHSEGQNLVRKLLDGTPIEVSTSYYRSVAERDGEFDGKAFNAVAYDLKPDHLALLLHERGACSWEDGCGVPRANREGEAMGRKNELGGNAVGGQSGNQVEQRESWWRNLALMILKGPNTAAESGTGAPETNEDSLDEQVRAVRDAYYKATSESKPDAPESQWVREVFADRIIVESGDKLLSVPYASNDDGVEFSDPVEVEVQYVEVKAEEENDDDDDDEPSDESDEDTGDADEDVSSNKEVASMEQIQLVANRYGIAAEELEGVPENVLAALAEHENPGPCQEFEALVEYAREHGGPEATLEVLQQAQADEEQALETLVTGLVANEACTFNEEELRAFPVETLQRLGQMLKPADFSGTPGSNDAERTSEDQEYDLAPMS